jgi:uncharacterized protein YkwD
MGRNRIRIMSGKRRLAALALTAVIVGTVWADAEDWDIRKLDTARDVDYMSALEKDVVLETNMVRSDPRKYAELYVKPRLQYFDGNKFSVPGRTAVSTKEGASAVQECIDELSKMKNVGLLAPEKGLYLAVRDHAADHAATGATGHDGSDGSKLSDRIARYAVRGKGASSAGENISYGKSDARDIILQLLIDDGTPSRGHRKNIMNGVYTQTGVAAGPHKVYGAMCVIDYANNYVTVTAAQPAEESTPPKPAETFASAPAPAALPQTQSPQTAELDKVLAGRGGAVETLNCVITPGRSVAILTVGSDYPRLSEYVVDNIAAKLAGNGRYKIIDRATIQEIADRKAMSVDDDVARFLGQKARVQTVIFGTIKPLGASGTSLRLEIKALDVAGGRVIERFGRTIARADAE